MKTKTLIIAGLYALSSIAANASHIFATDLKINGVALEVGGVGTAPTIVTASNTVTLTVGFFGDADTWSGSFAFAAGTLATPANLSVPYAGGATVGSPFFVSIPVTFGAGAGTWTGTITSDFPVSFPDYRASSNGAEFSEPTFRFTIQVGGVPDSGSTMGLMVMALLGLAVAARRRF